MKRSQNYDTGTNCHYCGVRLIRMRTPQHITPFYENGVLRPEYGIFSYDHKTPHAKGGTDDPSNLVTCCMKCNHEKGTTDYAIFMQMTAHRRALRAVQEFRITLKAVRAAPTEELVNILSAHAVSIYQALSLIYPNIPKPPAVNTASSSTVADEPAPVVEDGLTDAEQQQRARKLKKAQW